MKNVTGIGMALVGITLYAAPQIEQESVTFAQNQQSRKVTISYTLKNEPAIVTIDIQTNYTDGTEIKWASIGGTDSFLLDFASLTC